MNYNFDSSIFSQESSLSHKQQLVIQRIVKDFGSPIYIFHEEEFCNNFYNLMNSFQQFYPNYIPAYSYKTNYTPRICQLVKEMGGYAEVVSDMEYLLAKKLGYKNQEIIYNGPCKGELMYEHLLKGGILNIDNKDEALQIIELAKKYEIKQFKVGVRVNLDIDAGYTSRFGIELKSPSFGEVIELLNRCKNIKVVGLHCHISRARSLDAWKKRIETLLSAADKYIEGIPEFINVGSGMFADMDESLANQFDMYIPTYEEYAKVVGGAMETHYKTTSTKPTLFSEPGTTVVAKYLSLITTVNNVKLIKNQYFATVDSSFYNVGEICLMKNLPYCIIPKEEQRPTYRRVNIMGYTCLEQDCIYRNLPEDVSKGDLLVFGNLGGYSIVSKPPFIQPNCRMLSLTKKGELEEIKRAESFEDIFHTFIF